MSTPEILIPALRQYRPNIGPDDEYVAAFDYDETVRVVHRLQQQRDELFAENQRLRERLDSDRSVTGNYVTDEHGQRWVRAEYHEQELDKYQVDLEVLRARVDKLEQGRTERAEVKLTPAGFRG